MQNSFICSTAKWKLHCIILMQHMCCHFKLKSSVGPKENSNDSCVVGGRIAIN